MIARIPTPALVGFGCAALTAMAISVFTLGELEGVRKERLATTVRVGFPVYRGVFFGTCATVVRPAPGVSDRSMKRGQACATDEPEQSPDLLPGESRTVFVPVPDPDAGLPSASTAPTARPDSSAPRSKPLTDMRPLMPFKPATGAQGFSTWNGLAAVEVLA